MTGERAGRTATDSLASIERWARRACYAAITGAACLVLTAAAAGYLVSEYWRWKSAAREAMTEAAAELQRLSLQTGGRAE